MQKPSIAPFTIWLYQERTIHGLGLATVFVVTNAVNIQNPTSWAAVPMIHEACWIRAFGVALTVTLHGTPCQRNVFTPFKYKQTTKEPLDNSPEQVQASQYGPGPCWRVSETTTLKASESRWYLFSAFD